MRRPVLGVGREQGQEDLGYIQTLLLPSWLAWGKTRPSRKPFPSFHIPLGDRNIYPAGWLKMDIWCLEHRLPINESNNYYCRFCKRVNTFKGLRIVYSVSVRYYCDPREPRCLVNLGSSVLTEVMLCIWLLCLIKKRQKGWYFQKDFDMI